MSGSGGWSHQGKRVPPAAWGAAAGAADGASWVRRIGRSQGCQGWKAHRIPIQSGPTVRFPEKAEVLQPDEAQPERNVERETPGHKRMGHGSIERMV